MAIVAAPLALASTALLAACPGSEGEPALDDGGDGGDAPLDAGPSPCEAGYFGDPSKEMTLELRALRADGKDVALEAGDDLAVIFPPQGGRVAFVGVRATNLDGCAAQVIGALRDPVSGRVMVDGRTVNLARELDGWGTTGLGAALTNIEDSQAIANYANVPLCPNQWADQDVFDKPFEVEVSVTDRLKKKGGAKVMVTPRCAEPGQKETACRCLCRKGYVLGETCGEDAGALDAGGS